ncbi:unknown [Clostridium sp. CAG:492]|nr:unknown [Clostridium sp. CAG:492]
MKKSIKLMLTTLLAVMLLFSFSQPMVFAADSGDIINNLTSNDENIIKNGAGKVTDIGSKIMTWMWIISIVVAVIVLMYTGLKFIVGSTQEKAEYKKSLMPLVVGVIILVFATTIVNVIFSINS